MYRILFQRARADDQKLHSLHSPSCESGEAVPMGECHPEFCCDFRRNEEAVDVEAPPVYQEALDAFDSERDASERESLPSLMVTNLRTVSAPSLQALKLEITDAKLLRAALLSQVLRRGGCELRTNSLSIAYTDQEAATLYGRSTEVENIDYFISHCWQDSRMAKTLALYIHSNLWAAVVISSMVAVGCALLTYLKVLPVKEPNGPVMDIPLFPWAFFLGSASFCLVLIIWHQVRDPRHFCSNRGPKL